MRRYNITITTRLGAIIEETPLVSYNLVRDIMNPIKSTVVIPFISKAERGHFVSIYNPRYDSTYYAYRVHQGFISDITYEKDTTTLYILPMEALLDTNIYYSTSGLDTNLQLWVVNMIKSVIATNADNYMNFSNVFSADFTTTIVGADLGIESNIFNPFTLLKTILLKYGLMVYITHYPTIVQISILDVSTANLLIETNNPNVYKCNLDFSTNMLNKVIFVNQDDDSEKISYFLASNGTVSTNSSYLRIQPVIQDTQFYKPEVSFADETEILAKTALKVSEENFMIEIEGNERNLLLSSTPFSRFGHKYKIKHNDTIYVGTLTAYEVLTDETVRLTFGAVRADLTTLLGLERR